MKSNNQRRSSITSEDIIQDFRVVHGGKYDYSEVYYMTMHTPVDIICPIHGKFEQSPNAHIRQKQGCFKCAFERNRPAQRDTTQDFVVKAKVIHGDTYDYSAVQYRENAHQEVYIICKEHGVFKVTPNKHLSQKAGCQVCGKRRTGWTKSSWRLSCEGKVAKLYIIYCQSNEESFYKIGITNKPDLKGRFTCITLMPYTYIIIKIVEGEPDYIYDLEHILHRAHKAFRYNPIVHFDGDTECFSQIIQSGI